MGARRSGPRSTAGVLVVLLLGGLVWWLQGAPDTGTDRATGQPAASSTDAASGLPWISPDDLPAEARDTLGLIDRGGPYPEDEDDAVFGNYEGVLPDEPHGYYREYTVRTPGVDGRGARRVVTGDGGQYYWTADHYQSFARIRR
jgi:ribonuclease T1